MITVKQFNGKPHARSPHDQFNDSNFVLAIPSRRFLRYKEEREQITTAIALFVLLLSFYAHGQWTSHSRLHRDSFDDPWHENVSRIRTHGLFCCCAGCVATRHDLQNKEQDECDARMRQLTESGVFNKKQKRRDNECFSPPSTLTPRYPLISGEHGKCIRQTNPDTLPSDEKSEVNGNARGRVNMPHWMPRDTAANGTRFTKNDFLGHNDFRRSTRFKGGYFSYEFRENFINSRMEGLSPGDAGHDTMRRKAEGAWNRAVRQYDREFQQYGQEKLREQSRLDFQKRQVMEFITTVRTLVTTKDVKQASRLDQMMKSDMAAKASDYNRRAAYRTITGRDYEVDTNANLTDEAKQNYVDFNEIWSAMDVKDRVLFDSEGFQRGHVERLEAAEKELEAAEKANKD